MKYSAISAQEIDQKKKAKLGAIAPIKQAIQSILEHALIFFTQPRQIKIQQRTEQSGKVYWQVYHPVTGKTHYFKTETEVRVWLEQQYYC